MPTREIRPTPTTEEAAAIVSAVEALWPRPVAADPLTERAATTWRFSGRWWQRDRFAPVDRPWT